MLPPILNKDKLEQMQVQNLRSLHEAVHKCKRALHGTGSNQVGVAGIKATLDVDYVTMPDGTMTIREREQSSFNELGDQI